MVAHLPLLISSTMAGSAAVGAAAAWTLRSIRSPASEPAGAATPLPRLAPTAREIGGLVLIGAAATLLVIRLAAKSVTNLEALCLLFLLGAVSLRVLRLTRPGTPTLARLAAFLALVPGGSLLMGWLVGRLGSHISFGRTSTVELVVGAFATVGALLWIRRADRLAT